MTTFAIGDLHGCHDQLQLLLDKIQFNPNKDTLWFVGDLINRGPRSADTLRLVKSFGNSAVCVMGNHDMHLLAVAHGIRDTSPKDTLDDILKAPDKDELIDWLRQRPFLHRDPVLGITMVHAGIHPAWNLRLAEALAQEIERKMKSDRYDTFLQRLFSNKPATWSDKLGKHKRRRFAVNVFTRMRYCDEQGEMDFSCTSSPAKAPENLLPWYAVPNRKNIPGRIVFGHWSSHPAIAVSNVIPLDRGCVWQGSLTALALETGVAYSVNC